MQQIRQLVTPEVWEEGIKHFDAANHVAMRANRDYNEKEFYDEKNLFEWVSRAELSTYTHHQLLRDTDVMSMAHSLEVRVPLLDHVLVEKALRLRERIKRQGTMPKPLLNAALSDVLPPVISNRQDKQGFTFPFDKWLRSAWKEDATTRLEEVQQHDWLRKDQSSRLLPDFEAGKLHWSRPWAMIALGSVLES
jgi:asparagine synthase (glutamine-hydrolysing)